MSNYYDATGQPANRSKITSSAVRAEFAAVATGLSGKLPPLVGHGSEVCRVNAGGTGIESVTLAVLLAGALVLSGPLSGVTSLSMGGALSGVTTLSMAGALSGVTTLAMTGALSGTTDLTTTGNTILGNASADTLNVGAGGIVKDASGNTTLGGILLHQAGSVGAPAITPVGDANTGLWAPAADTYALSAGGVEVWRAISTAFHPGGDATLSLGLAAKRYTIGYMGAVSDGALATNELVGSAGTVARYGAGSVWTQLLLYANNAARIRIGTTGDLTPEADAAQGCGSATKRFLLCSAQTFADGAYATGGFVGSSGTTARYGYGSGWTDVAIGPGGTDRLHVVSDGRVYGSALHNNAGAVTGTVNQYIASGTYTPTLTNTTNITSSTAYGCQWTRVGNVVTVSGKFDQNVTSASGTVMGLSLPIASNLTATEQCAGLGMRDLVSGGSNPSVSIRADAANDRAEVWYAPPAGGVQTIIFYLMYLIL